MTPTRRERRAADPALSGGSCDAEHSALNGTEAQSVALLIAALDQHGYEPDGEPPHWVARCPCHADNEPSLVIDVKPSRHWPHEMTVLVFCTCRASLTDVCGALRIETWRVLNGNEQFRRTKPSPPPRPLTSRMVGQWIAQLWLVDDGARLDYLTDKRGLFRETIETYRIGFDPYFDRYTLPVYDSDDVLVNVRRYDPHADGQRKMLNTTGYGSPARLYPCLPPSGPVVICEGEFDALLLRQHGFPACTSTHGAGTFLPEWVEHFADRPVAFVYDCDNAGRVNAPVHAAAVAEVAASVRVVDLDAARSDKWDVSDWFNEGRSAADLRVLINAAVPLS
jgi:hypothetical protein